MDCCFARSLARLAISVEVRRPPRSTYLKGRWQTQDSETTTIDAAVQPAKPEELLRLDDARHIQEAIILFTQDRLYTVDVDQKIQPDVVLYHEHEFEVESVEDWGSFLKVIAVRRERP